MALLLFGSAVVANTSAGSASAAPASRLTTATASAGVSRQAVLLDGLDGLDDRAFVDNRADPTRSTFDLGDAVWGRAAQRSITPLVVDSAGRVSMNPVMAFVVLEQAGLFDRTNVTAAEIDARLDSTAAVFYGARTANPDDPASGLRAVVATGWPGTAGTGERSFIERYRALHGDRANSETVTISGGAAQGLPPLGFLALPWTEGAAWSFNGVHTTSGSNDGSPMSSIDASMNWPPWGTSTLNAVVRAAHPGVVTVYSTCFVRVTATNGWATNYYHLSNLQVVNGQSVAQGAALAVYADNISQALCQGGSSTGPHTHLSLLRNGFQSSIDGAVFGGWLIHAGRYSYDSSTSYMWLDRGPVRRYAYQSFANVLCPLVISPASAATIPSLTGTISIDVVTLDDCPWEVVIAPTANWLRPVSGLTGLGNESVVLAFDANPGPMSRFTDLQVGIDTIRITQRAGDSGRTTVPAASPANPASRGVPPSAPILGVSTPGRVPAPAA